MRARIEIAGFSMAAILVPSRIIGHLALQGTPANRPGALWMPIEIGILLAVALSMRYVGVARRHPAAVGFAGLCAMSAAVAAHLSSLGGFDGPFFYAVYLVPTPLIMIPVPLRTRALMTVAAVLAYVVTFCGLHPEHLNHPMLHIPFTSLAMECVLGLVFGHSIYKQMRERHELSMTVERLAAEKARSEERRAIARVLHDDLAQLNTAARMEVSAIESKIARGNVGLTELAYLKGLLDSFERSSRRVVLNLRDTPEALETRIERMCTSASRAVEVKAELRPCAAAPDVQEVIASVVQEGLTNALRHAEARRIDVHLQREGDAIVATVRDDGRGFDPKGPDAKAGFGIVGLRERATALGGKLTIESAPTGTCLSVRVPSPVPSTPPPAPLRSPSRPPSRHPAPPKKA